ncbi:MAG: hypothetical protein F4184_09935 [Gemmatimonadetes bacterium]|nr:hypothetical protein [Gemmatimonadota bacterium]
MPEVCARLVPDAKQRRIRVRQRLVGAEPVLSVIVHRVHDRIAAVIAVILDALLTPPLTRTAALLSTAAATHRPT